MAMTTEQKANKAVPIETVLLWQANAKAALDKATKEAAEAQAYHDGVESMLLSHEFGLWPGQTAEWAGEPDLGRFEVTHIQPIAGPLRAFVSGKYASGKGTCGGYIKNFTWEPSA